MKYRILQKGNHFYAQYKSFLFYQTSDNRNVLHGEVEYALSYDDALERIDKFKNGEYRPSTVIHLID